MRVQGNLFQSFFFCKALAMTRGNQRELARQKNMKKQADQKKGREIPDGMNLTAIKTLYYPLNPKSSIATLKSHTV